MVELWAFISTGDDLYFSLNVCFLHILSVIFIFYNSKHLKNEGGLNDKIVNISDSKETSLPHQVEKRRERKETRKEGRKEK